MIFYYVYYTGWQINKLVPVQLLQLCLLPVNKFPLELRHMLHMLDYSFHILL